MIAWISAIFILSSFVALGAGSIFGFITLLVLGMLIGAFDQ